MLLAVNWQEKINISKLIILRKLKFKNTDKGYYIWDLVRKKYVKLTPEEMVRQNYIKYLNEVKGYSKELMILEYPFLFNGKKKRADLVVIKDSNPFLISEFKSNKVKIDENVIDQVMIYNKNINAKYLSITNGVEMLVLEKKEKNYKQIEEVPLWEK